MTLADVTRPRDDSDGFSSDRSSADGSDQIAASLVGEVVDGTVTGITHFGDFVNLKEA